MASIVYVDGDDEITSAAARIRGSDDGPVALVVSHGSRIATSRINFRMLAREAQSHGRRLSIVAGDGATRALAASAGLPVFGSVGEYEGSLAAETAKVDPVSAPVPAPPAAPAATAASRGVVASPRAGDGTGRGRKTRVLPDPTVVVATAAAPSVAVPAVAAPQATAASLATAATVPAPGAETGRGAAPGPPDVGPRRTAAPPTDGGRRPWRLGREAAPVVVALAALALLAVGVGAYVLLPAASIAITPRQEAMVPLAFVVRADPAAATAGPAGGVIPARRLSFDVAASDTFPVRGKRIEEAKATGRVTFRSYNSAAENTIPAGSIVSTEGGIQFHTMAAVRLARARVFPPSRIVPSSASVAIEAVKAGTAANVPPNAITVVPKGEDPLVTNVRNVDPTSGGKHDEFPKIDQADVDAALTQLTEQLGKDFDTLVADPAHVPPGMTVFPDTRSLADPVPSSDPAGLIGQEVASFELEMTSTGTVTSVDESAVTTLAADRMRAAVGSGRRLVDGSIEVTVGAPSVAGEIVMFPVTATAKQVQVLDPKSLAAQVKGKPAGEARRILAAYGEVELSLWPDWVTSVPGIDARIDVHVAATPANSPLPSGSPAPGASTAAPTPGSPGASAP